MSDFELYLSRYLRRQFENRNMTAYRCKCYLNTDMEELYLTHGCLDFGICVGDVVIDDIERRADFSVQG